MLNRRGKNNEDGSFNWGDAMADAGISAGLTFFTTLGGTTATGIPTKAGILAAGIAACSQFFAVLAIKRGVKE